MGKGTDRSDFDIGIEGDTPVPPKAMAAIKEEIDELPVLNKIEVVDFRKVPEKFYKVAKQHIEPLTKDV